MSYSTDGQNWIDIAEVNAANWPNFTVTLPISNWQDLANLQVRIENIATTQDPVPPVYLDGMFVEAHYEVPSALPATNGIADAPTILLENSAGVTVVSGSSAFGPDENPVFNITDPNLSASDIDQLIQNNQAEIVNDPNNILETEAASTTAASSTDTSSTDSTLSSFLDIPTARADGPPPDTPDIVDATVLNADGSPSGLTTQINQGQVIVDKDSRQFQPGKYTLRVAVKTDEAIIISEQDFTWGVLAINTNKSIYEPGDDANLAMGVLDNDGNTICDADLTLVITSPSGDAETLSSANGGIQNSGLCAGNTDVDVPDYSASYTIPQEIGTYQMSFTAVTDEGTNTIEDSFEVETAVPFDISRTGPTRIFPVDPYPVSISITPVANWQGVVAETVPASFQISPSDQGVSYNNVQTQNGNEVISWDVSLQAGQTTTLAYSFLAPPVSPEFYLIGPAVLTDQSGDVSFQEAREWQIASDAGACTSKTGTLNWASSTSWNAGCSGAGIPGTGDDVTIAAGAIMTYNVTSSVFSIDSLTLAGGASTTVLTFSGTDKLTVSTTSASAVTVNQPTAATSSILTVGTGSLVITSGGLSLPGTSATASHIANVTVTTGSLTVGGSITYGAQAAAANAVVQTTGTGGITVTGAETQAAGTLQTTSSGALTLSGGLQISSGNTATFTCGATGKVSLGGNFTAQISPTFTTGCVTTFTANSTVTPTAAITFASVTISGGTVTLAGNITLATSTWTNNSGASALSGGSNTITLATGTQTIAGSFGTPFPNLVIGSGALATLNTSSTATSLTFATSSLASSLTHGTNVNLTVNGNVTLNQPSAAKTTSWNINAGTATVTGNISFAGTTSTASYIVQTAVTTGALTVDGNVAFTTSITAAADQVVSVTTGSLTIDGNQTLNCGTIKDGGVGTMIFNGTFTFGSAACTPSFSSTSGATIEYGNSVTVMNSVLTYTAGSITQFIGNATVTPTTAITFSNLTIVSGTVSTAGNISAAATTTLSGGVLSLGGTLSVTGNWINNDSATALTGNFPVTMAGVSTTIGGTFLTPFYGLTLAAAASTTLATNITVGTGGLNFSGGATAAILNQNSGTTLTVNGSVTMTQPTTASRTNIWNIGAGTATVNGTTTLANTAVTVTKINEILLTTGTLTLNGNLTTGGGTGDATAAVHVLDISQGAGILNFGGILETSSTAGGSGWTFATTTVTTCVGGGGTFVYDATSTQTIYMPSVGGYCNLEPDNSSNTILNAAITTANLINNLTIGDGTTAAVFTNNSLNIAGNGSAMFTVASGTIFNLTGTTATFPTGFATYTFDPASTMNYEQTSAQTVAAENYGNLAFIPPGTVTYTLAPGAFGVQGNLTIGDGTHAVTADANANDPTITVAGNVSIASAATFGGSGTNPISIGGNWNNAGTFTANSGNVTLDTNSTAIVSGSSTFYDLTVTSTVAKEVDFNPSGSPLYTVTDAFTAIGSPGNLIKLHSVSSGTQWMFHPIGTASVSYADIQDGGCASGSINIDAMNSINSGDNGSCWFGGPPSVYNVFLNGSQNIVLSPDATETIYVTASTSDLFGPGNLSYATGTIYRTSLGNSCTASQLNCYQIASSSCVFSNSSSTVTCSADIWYFADSTGVALSSYPSDSWTGAITVTNAQGNATMATSSSMNVGVLAAINITTSTINYGTIAPGSTTSSTDQMVTIQNAGNASTALEVYGTALASGGNLLATSSQHYATSTFTFGGTEQLLSDSATTVADFSLAAPTSTSPIQANLYWGLGVSGGAAGGTYSGGITFVASALSGGGSGYSYYRAITVTSTASIASGTLTNFPMLVSSTYADWASSVNGGVIRNLVTAPNGGQEAADLVFATSTANCTAGNYLNFETESYNSSTGALVDWVNVPAMQTGTVIYACYDNISVTTDQSHPSGTWNSNYRLVWHLPTVNGALNASDSTSNANNGTISGASATTTKIDGGDFNNLQQITIGSNSSIAVDQGSFTVSVWINTTANPSYGAIFDKGSTNRDLSLFMNGGKLAYCGVGSGFTCDAVAGTATLNDGNWHQIVWTRSGSAMTFYVDGTVDATQSDSSNVDSGATLSLGQNPSGGGSAWAGSYDEFEIATSSFSSSWVVSSYNSQAFPDDSQGGKFYHVGAQTAF